MDEPISFGSHWRVRPGSLKRLQELSADVAARFRAERPRTLSWLAYLDDTGTKFSFVHVFADAEAMDLHGTPAASAVRRICSSASPLPLRLEPQLVAGGFLRLAAE